MFNVPCLGALKSEYSDFICLRHIFNGRSPNANSDAETLKSLNEIKWVKEYRVEVSESEKLYSCSRSQDSVPCTVVLTGRTLYTKK